MALSTLSNNSYMYTTYMGSFYLYNVKNYEQLHTILSLYYADGQVKFYLIECCFLGRFFNEEALWPIAQLLQYTRPPIELRLLFTNKLAWLVSQILTIWFSNKENHSHSLLNSQDIIWFAHFPPSLHKKNSHQKSVS